MEHTFRATVNAPEYPPQLKHQVILQTFESLESGEEMLLVNDHDPVPLQYQFRSLYPDGFTWEYLEQGPLTFRVAIGRR